MVTADPHQMQPLRHDQLALLKAAISQVNSVKDAVVSALADFVDDAGARTGPAVLARLHFASSHIQALQQQWHLVEGALTAAATAAAAASASSQPSSSMPEQHAAPEWCMGVSKQAAASADALEQRILRSQLASTSGMEPPSKRLRTGVSQQRQQVVELQQVVQRVQQHAQHVELYMASSTTTSTSATNADLIKLVCPRVLCACIALAGPGSCEAVRVVIGTTERAVELDGWAAPQHEVFRRISALATCVLGHLQQQAPTAMLMEPRDASGHTHGSMQAWALEGLLLWLTCYDDLFARPCTVTGQLLCWDPASGVPLPPLMRPFNMPRSKLLEVCSNKAARCAYHVHATPPGFFPDDAALSARPQAPDATATTVGAGLAMPDADDAVTEQRLRAALAELFPGQDLDAPIQHNMSGLGLPGAKVVLLSAEQLAPHTQQQQQQQQQPQQQQQSGSMMQAPAVSLRQQTAAPAGPGALGGSTAGVPMLGGAPSHGTGTAGAAPGAGPMLISLLSEDTS